VVISSFPTDGAGRFTATIFVPVSGEGAHTIRAIDVLGNVAESTYYTSFGFNNIRDQISAVNEQLSRRIDQVQQAMPREVDVNRLADLVAERLKPSVAQGSSNQMAEIALGIAVVAVAVAAGAIVLSSRRVKTK
ncbi:MAG: hypothetical protein QXW52_04760, partial [Candidatus Caldarchaeum sp.]